MIASVLDTNVLLDGLDCKAIPWDVEARRFQARFIGGSSPRHSDLATDVFYLRRRRRQRLAARAGGFPDGR